MIKDNKSLLKQSFLNKDKLNKDNNKTSNSNKEDLNILNNNNNHFNNNIKKIYCKIMKNKAKLNLNLTLQRFLHH